MDTRLKNKNLRERRYWKFNGTWRFAMLKDEKPCDIESSDENTTAMQFFSTPEVLFCSHFFVCTKFHSIDKPSS